MAGWGVFAICFPLVAVLAVHIRRPRAPAAVLAQAGEDPAAARLFELQYIETLKARQVATVWLWAAIGAVINVLVLSAL